MAQPTSCTVPALDPIKVAILGVARDIGYIPIYRETPSWLYGRMNLQEQPQNRRGEPRVDLVKEALDGLFSEGKLVIEEHSYVLPPQERRKRQNGSQKRKRRRGRRAHKPTTGA